MPHEHTPRDVVLAALATTLPATGRPDVEARADLIVAALIEHGHLPQPRTGLTLSDMHAAAQWLAEESQFPRYTVEDGWKRIAASTADVNVAAAKALMLAATEDQREDILRAKHDLLRWHHEHNLPVGSHG